ncbi:hypothetical protein Y900_029555 [Mycolicibacterium aromaticivorans JS19b1 = JCM 16368]|uniref:Polyketide cyclase n=1 Tax=Mycolicibacterium aromaticivorans JS19b1 = JCM 16368 TaxID=1440774 RepID=A0A064CAV8_9MYCO|nr:SRPBCC family protein [Mycolicibacterium aromaticivorans]KDE96786.1 hypothetical protein Y900_029555 [Mycolicibacterium aromaticivorans JS19b1 = JCM 16368]
MAHGTTASVFITHPVHVVWDYIINPDNISHVLPGLLATYADKEPPYQAGDRWYGKARLFGITYDWVGVFTRVVLPRRMEFESTQSRFPFATCDILEEVPGGTRYTCQVTGEALFGGTLGRVVDALASKAYQRMLSRHRERLPEHVDAWASTRHS